MDEDFICLAGSVNPGFPIEFVWIRSSSGEVIQILSPYPHGFRAKTENHEASYVQNPEYIPLKKIA